MLLLDSTLWSELQRNNTHTDNNTPVSKATHDSNFPRRREIREQRWTEPLSVIERSSSKTERTGHRKEVRKGETRFAPTACFRLPGGSPMTPRPICSPTLLPSELAGR